MSGTRKAAVGGAILGYGRRTTIVYTADDLTEVLPGLFKVCLVDHVHKNHDGKCLRPEEVTSCADLQGLAIKDTGVTNKVEALREARWNARVFQWFERVQKAELTTLHPRYNHLHVAYAPAPTPRAGTLVFRDASTSTSTSTSKAPRTPRPHPQTSPGADVVERVLPLYREFDGSLTDLMITNPVQDHVLVAAACSVLDFLTVLHAHGHVHLDVKPDNILFEYVNARPRFRLSDYETLERAEHVVAQVRRVHRFVQGTDGYMSPLLTLDDSDNKVFPQFRAVAAVERIASARTDAQLHAMFAEAKAAIAHNVYKTDLHSLALTMMDVMTHAVEEKESPKHIKRRFPRAWALLPRLLFFRKNIDFASAAVALSAALELARA